MRHPIVIWFLLLSTVLAAQKDTVMVLRPDLKTFFADTVNENNGYNSIKFSSLRERDEREAIGSVYVMDRRMIQATGARDIKELLEYVPSISFGRDVNDAVGITMRGLWVHEGKFILMINGMPINELSFGTYCFIKRLTLDNVSHVEIVLGPGSVNYGGTASLGVINVVTLQAGQRDGTSVNCTISGTETGVDRQNIGLMGNHYLGNSTFFSYSYSGLKGSRVVNLEDSGINWGDSTKMSNEEFFISIERKNLKVQVYQNDYNFSVFGEQLDVQMKTSNADITYNQKLGSRSLFNAQVGYIRQLPWNIQNTVDFNLINSNTISERIHFQSQFNTKYGKYFESNIGIQAYDIHSQRLSIYADRISANALKVADGSKGLGVFLETYGRFAFGTLSFAGRGEFSNLVRPQWAPRIGYCLLRKNWHIKVSYAESYKIPTIENFYLGPDGEELKSERNKTVEFEVGGRFTSAMTWRVNGYANRLVNPIIYVFDDITYDNYLNRKSVANRGAETMLTYLSNNWTIRLSCSYNELDVLHTEFNEVVTPRAHLAQGIPNILSNFIVNYQWSRAWSTSISGQYKSAMYNYEYLSEEDEQMTPVLYDPTFRVNLFASYIPTRLSDFELRFGILNIFNTQEYYLNPYSVGLNSIPSAPRELSISLSYRITH